MNCWECGEMGMGSRVNFELDKPVYFISMDALFSFQTRNQCHTVLLVETDRLMNHNSPHAILIMYWKQKYTFE